MLLTGLVGAVPGAGAAGKDERATAAIAVGVTTRSYRSDLTLEQVQTLVVTGVGGTFRLRFTDGAQSDPIVLAAPACVAPGADPDLGCDPGSVQAQLTALGKDAAVTDGPDGLSPPMPAIRYTITFADPAVAALSADASRLEAGPGIPAQAQVECVFCLDDYGAPAAPTGAAVLFVHGGGMITGTKSEWSSVADAFAARGYRTFSMNYRLFAPPRSTLAGCSFAPSPFPVEVCDAWRASIDGATSDVASATTWLRANAEALGIDGARVAVIGFSAGATLALHAANGPGGDDGIPTAVVGVSGVMDRTLLQGAAPPTLLLTTSGVDTAYAGGFLHGIDAQAENEAVISASRALGTIAYLRSYPGAAHGISPYDAVWPDAVEAALDFLDHHVAAGSDVVVGGTWLGDAAGLRTGTAQQRGATPGEAPEPVVGDFDGDGIQDILWYGAGAALDSIWFGGDEGTFRDPIEWSGDFSTYRPAVDVGGTYEPVVADLDHDGRDDIIWHSPLDGRGSTLWFGQTDGSFTALSLGDVPAGVHIAVGDFNGDAGDDLLLWSHALNGALLIHTVPGVGYEIAFAHAGLAPGARPLLGDFDGDGRTDIFWAAGSASSLWYTSGLLGAAAVTAVPVDAPPTADGVVGDFDGDRLDDVAWYAPDAPGARWYGTPERGRFDAGAALPIAATAPVLFDHLADGTTDLVWPGDEPTAPVLLRGNSDRAAATELLGLPAADGGRVIAGSFHRGSPAGRASDLVWYWHL